MSNDISLFVLEYEDEDGYSVEKAVLADDVYNAMYDNLPPGVAEVQVQEAELVGKKTTYMKNWGVYKS